MEIDGNIVRIVSAHVVLQIGDNGHVMKIEISDKGNGEIFGAVVVEHKLPKGGTCKQCSPNVLTLHTELKALIQHSVHIHLKHCHNKPRKQALRLIS